MLQPFCWWEKQSLEKWINPVSNDQNIKPNTLFPRFSLIDLWKYSHQMKMETGTIRIQRRIPNLATVKKQTNKKQQQQKTNIETKPERLHSIYLPGKDVLGVKKFHLLNISFSVIEHLGAMKTMSSL